MITFRKCLLGLLLASTSTQVLLAGTYYVSTAGNDSNNGSQSSPWLTVQKAASSVKPGDVVNIGSGTYDESVTVATSGTSAAAITFNGPATVRQFNVTGNYVTLANLAIGTANVSTDAVRLGGTGDIVTGCSFNLFSKSYGAITITGSSCVASNCDMTGVDIGTVVTFRPGSANNLAVACNIHDMHDVDAFHLWGVSNFIRGCTVYNLDNPTVSVWHADFVQIYGDNGESGSFDVVENNYVHDCSCQIGNFTTDVGDLHDITFRNNVFVNVASCGFVGIRNFTWYNNIFYKCGSWQTDVLMFYQIPDYDSTGAQVINNIFLQCGADPSNTGDGTIGSDGQNLSTLNISYNYFGGNGFAAKTGGYVGTHAINGGDPKLLNASASDFHLVTNSPLIGAGVNLYASFIVDKDGNPRPAIGNWDLGPYQHGGSSGGGGGNPVPPTVSAITENASDVDPVTAGVQVYEGTIVQYSGSGTVPAGDAMTWKWSYAINGGNPVSYQTGSGNVSGINFNYTTGTAGNTYVWTLTVTDTTTQLSAQSSLTMSVEAPPAAGTNLTFLAGQYASLTAPMVLSGGYISQATQTTVVSNGGHAVYNFTLTNSGNYVIQALINAPGDAANSMFVNIDGEPVSPTMIWDIPITSGFQQTLVSWRGTGTDTNNQFVPEVFNLATGAHRVVIVGREAGVQLQSFSILQLLTAPQNLHVLPTVISSPTFSVGD